MDSSEEFDRKVEEKIADFRARIAAGEHVADVTCTNCGWTRFATVYPEWTGYRATTVKQALEIAIADLERHISLKKDGKCYPYRQ